MTDLLRKILEGGYTDLYKRQKSGTWGLVIDTHFDITEEEVEAVFEATGDRTYRLIGSEGERTLVKDA